jgi:hypothetical protein
VPAFPLKRLECVVDGFLALCRNCRKPVLAPALKFGQFAPGRTHRRRHNPLVAGFARRWFDHRRVRLGARGDERRVLQFTYGELRRRFVAHCSALALSLPTGIGNP